MQVDLALRRPRMGCLVSLGDQGGFFSCVDCNRGVGSEAVEGIVRVEFVWQGGGGGGAEKSRYEVDQSSLCTVGFDCANGSEEPDADAVARRLRRASEYEVVRDTRLQ